MALPYYKRFPRDFLEGTIGLTLEEKGAYGIVLDLIYMRDGALQDDPRYIAGQLGCSLRKWSSIRDRLVEIGKIQCFGGIISNFRADYLLEETRKYQDKMAENGSKPKQFNNLEKPKLNQTEPEPEPEEDKEDELCPHARVLEGWPQDYEAILLAETKIGRHQSITEFALWHHNGFDFEAEVLPAIRSVMTSGRPPPKTWKYFSPVIAQLRADRSNPIHIPEANHVRNNNLQSRSGGQRSKAAGLKAAIAVANRRAERASGAG